jgi:hypothetical protein
MMEKELEDRLKMIEDRLEKVEAGLRNQTAANDDYVERKLALTVPGYWYSLQHQEWNKAHGREAMSG